MRSHHQASRPARAANRGGFTLLEILIVLAIIGVIAAMAVPNLLANRDKANIDNAKILIANVQKAAELWSVRNQGYPNTVDQLLTSTEAGVPPQLDKIPTDAWGTPIMYEYPNSKNPNSDKPAIWSAGKNRTNENGAGDDINNWIDPNSVR